MFAYKPTNPIRHLMRINFNQPVRFEVIMAMNMKITICRDVTPCSLVHRYQHF
jgi:hypothetical protein